MTSPSRVFALILFTLFSFGAVSASEAVSPDWMTDFEAASAKAKETGKPLLLDFTGSDWCGWCIRLDKEVFSQDAFARYASENLILLKLDFPRRTEISPELKAQNQQLAEKFGIRGFPTILLMSPEGELIGKTGYKPGGADAYVEHLKSMMP